MRLANVMADSATEATSNGVDFGVVMFLTNVAPSTRATAAMGSTMRNIHRQDMFASTNPENVGPMAGATEITMEISPMVRPRRETGTNVSTVVINNGSMTAVPLACTTRAATSTGNTGARAPSNVPRVNRAIAPMNSDRVEKRVRISPVVGMTTAIVSMNAVVSHCAVAAVTEKVSINSGMATDMIVSLRIMTNAATSSTPITSFTCGEIEASSVAASSAAVSSAAGLRGAGAGESGSFWAGSSDALLVARSGLSSMAPPAGALVVAPAVPLAPARGSVAGVTATSAAVFAGTAADFSTFIGHLLARV